MQLQISRVGPKFQLGKESNLIFIKLHANMTYIQSKKDAKLDKNLNVT
jgi:hypothetical protein